MEAVQNGILVLYTSLLTPGSTNRFGTANTNNTDLTFTNINIKQIIGTNCGRYQKFNLVLNSVIVPTTATNIGIGNDANILLYMSGLPFDQSNTYSSISGICGSTTFIGATHIVNNSSTNSNLTTYPPTFFNTFLRGPDIIDITISLRSAVATVTATDVSFLLTPTTIYPQMVYTFSIIPVIEQVITHFPAQEDKAITYQQRLFKS